jgi:plastocyanin
MKKVLLHALVLVICLGCSTKDEPVVKNAAAWTVTASSYSFNPTVLTITQGDSVNFHLANIDDVVEVSLATWNANGNDLMPGFSLPYGGGTLHSSQLSVGTHYYVSSLHSTLGMKGIIVVKQ